MTRKYFGTDGVRGLVGESPITPEFVMHLGWAMGRVLGRNAQANGERANVLIGKDTRVSGYMLESALEAGLSAAGIDITLVGPMPTPGVAFLTRNVHAQAGVVISASHNSYEDNGIKFFSHEGMKLPDDVERQIEAELDKPMQTVASRVLGKAYRIDDAARRYIEFCKSSVPIELSLKGIRIVVDCANGAGYDVAPRTLQDLGADVIAIANQPDGFNINLECGSTYPQNLQAAVVEHKADLGIALDGDGDRLLFVNAQGDLLDGDQILYILCSWRHSQGKFNGGVVGTHMTNLGFERALANINMPFERAQVGDRYVMQGLLKHGWLLGGEPSGHIICLDKTTTGDAIIASLGVLWVLQESGRSLSELVCELEIYPQTMVNVFLDHSEGKVDAKCLCEHPSVLDAVKEAETELAGRGRIVLRASGTEPLVRVMVEGQDANQVARISEQIAQTVRIAAVS